MMVMMMISSPKNLLCMKADVEEELGNKLNRNHWKIFGLLWLYAYSHTTICSKSTASYMARNGL